MKKIISLDIDGTLYNSQRQITPTTRAALLRAQEKGAVLVLASGRPTAGLVPIAQELDMQRYHGMLLSYNGGVVQDFMTGEVIYSCTIPVPLAKNLLRHLEKFPVNPIVDDGKTIYTTDPNGFKVPYESQSNHLAIRQVENICDAVDFSPAKILIASPEDILQEHTLAISQPFAEHLSFVLSAPVYLEATPFGVNKADALRKTCEVLGVSTDDIIAFGDAQNDIPMLKLAGYGVAMGNACSALKEIADEVTATNDEDGIARTLEKMGL